MKMKYLQYLALLLTLTVAMVSCSGDGFKIDGDITNIEGDALRVIFATDSGMVDEWVNIEKNGKFSYRGNVSEEPVTPLFHVPSLGT